MNNRYGLDVEYFRGKLTLMLQKLDNYMPEELARELRRYADAAEWSVDNYCKSAISIPSEAFKYANEVFERDLSKMLKILRKK